MSGIDSARDEKWSEWIEWSGGECPLPDDVTTQVKLRADPQNERYGFSERWLWKHNGFGSDIIAYRYKIKEPESDMHSDLEWLARNVSEWKQGPDLRLSHEEATHIRRHINSHCLGYGSADDEWFARTQWQAARQQLGLDDSTMTPEEEEAWEAKERELIGGPRKAENFLMQAANLMAERGKQYDQPGGERSMSKAVSALNAITGRDITEAEGWLLMSLVKRVRQHSGAGYHKDSAEDAVAYAALEAEALESSRG